MCFHAYRVASFFHTSGINISGIRIFSNTGGMACMRNHSSGQVLTDLLVVILLFLTPIAIASFHQTQKLIDQQKAEKPHYAILIDVNENTLYLLRNGSLFKSYLCATGKSDTPSPLGSFKIIKKSLWGEGFGGYYMGLNCTWGNYGIHGTTNPGSVGYDASHGCFRMYTNDVKELYGFVPIGTSVEITGGNYGVFGNGFRSIGPGMYGADIQAIQLRLKALGFYAGKCTGKYNSAGFRKAVHRYQQSVGLPVSDTVTKKMIASLGFVMIE